MSSVHCRSARDYVPTHAVIGGGGKAIACSAGSDASRAPRLCRRVEAPVAVKDAFHCQTLGAENASALCM
jgi:hypothetical protein